MKTMIVNEVKKTMVQVTNWTGTDVQQMINLCKTYRTNKGGLVVTRVDADDLKNILVNECGIPGAMGDWNKLASLVCITIEK